MLAVTSITVDPAVLVVTPVVYSLPPSCVPLEVVENLQSIEEEGDIYESIEEIWPDYPTKDDFFFNEDEY